MIQVWSSHLLAIVEHPPLKMLRIFNKCQLFWHIFDPPPSPHPGDFILASSLSYIFWENPTVKILFTSINNGCQNRDTNNHFNWKALYKLIRPKWTHVKNESKLICSIISYHLCFFLLGNKFIHSRLQIEWWTKLDVKYRMKQSKLHLQH